jgi:ABC-type phosphate transport system substrate-binding protein
MAAPMSRLALVLAILLLAAASASERESVAVIVNPARRVELSIDDLAQIYLRRKRFWNDGAPMVPLNLLSAHPFRERFSRQVLRRSDARLAEYWNREYFYGILPPATLASTEAMRRYVASDPNAIGYVPSSLVDDSVRVLFRLE